MLSSLHSSNRAIPEAAQTPSIQAIPEAVQTTHKLTMAMRIHRWFHRSMYDESLSGDNIDEDAFPKLRLLCSIWIKKVLVISNNFLAIFIGLGFGIAALHTKKSESQFFCLLLLCCIYCSLVAHNSFMLSVLKLKQEPLEVMGSLEALSRINTVWSQRLWCGVGWPISTCALVIVYHVATGDLLTVFDLLNWLKP